MSKKRILSIFGTRPEATKMCPLVRQLEQSPHLESVVCVTAQHRQMLDQVLEVFDMKPDFDLDIMTASQSLGDITRRGLEGLEHVYAEVHPDMVLVHGDTTTTFTAALAAFYQKIPVGHVEAGLRSFDTMSPYPEEINRLLTDRMSALHFAPTDENAANLKAEGITDSGIYVTGNTAIDCLNYTIVKDYTFTEKKLRKIDFNRDMITVTAHRRENYGQGMENIMSALKRLAQDNPDLTLVYPVHLSPYVQQTAAKYLSDMENVLLIPPLGVVDMHNLMARSTFILTDSGGLQEEAPSLNKPVLVMRKETERPEAVKAGTIRVCGVEEEDIYQEASVLLEKGERYHAMIKAVNPYGDGKASQRIVHNLLHHYGIETEPVRWEIAP